jgi:hypothetical protein
MLKRSLLNQDCPKVIFLDEYKWDLDFIVDNCFSVCDRLFPWKDCITNTPLAFAMASSTRARQQTMSSQLRHLGFDIIAESSPKQGENQSSTYVIIGANNIFQHRLSLDKHFKE